MAKILLVEDDNNLREIYEARLAAEGYDIVAASDGEQALTVAMKEKPDLIISDVMMPKISGFDMLDILRTTEETKNAKIIMMTALSQAEDKERAEKLGADRYLVKSQVTLEDVAKVAREVLEGTPTEPATNASVDPIVAATASEEPVIVDSNAVSSNESTQLQTPQQSGGDTTATESSSAAPQQADTPIPTPTAATPVAPAQQQSVPVQPEPASEAPSPTTPAPTAGLDAVASSTPGSAQMQPPTTPTSAPTQIPIGTQTNDPSTDGSTVVAPDPTTTATPDPTTDPVNDSLLTEEQIIAQQIKDSLNISTQPKMPDQPVDPIMNTSTPPSSIPVSDPDTPQPAAGDKTIQPINDMNAPGPDLEAMAAKEDSAASVLQPPTQEPTVIQPTITVQNDAEAASPVQMDSQPSQTADNNKSTDTAIDPNSIAL